MVDYDLHGYDQIRNYIQSNWNWLAILNDSGTELLRWDLTANANVTVVSDETSDPLEYTITVTGQDIVDAGYSLPQTLSNLELYETSGASTRVGGDTLRDSEGNATTATMEATSDAIEVTFTQNWIP
jgi:hypothetical protein